MSKKRGNLLVPKLQYCQFEQSQIAEKTEPLSWMISWIWLVVKCLENLVIEKIFRYIEWLLKHLSVFKLTYCVFNYCLTHKSDKKSRWFKKKMLLKNVFSLNATVFDPRNSSSHLLFLSDILIYLSQKSTCNHPLLHVQWIRQIFSISGVLLFQRSTYSDRFWVDRHYFRRLILVFI